MFLQLFFQVNSKALLMFQDSFSDEVHEHIFWPDLPYVTDEHGSKFGHFRSPLLYLVILVYGWNLHFTLLKCYKIWLLVRYLLSG